MRTIAWRHLAPVLAWFVTIAAAAFFTTGLAEAKNARTLHKPIKPRFTIQVPDVRSPTFRSPDGGSWQAVAPAPFGAGTMLQLTDGRVLVHDSCTRDWWTLTPNSRGSYANGKWTQVASMQAGYGPLYFSSALLPDGRVVVNGGEYNNSGSGCPQNGAWTTKGSIYDPVADAWTEVLPPSGWSTIGDAQNVVLPDGRYWLANCCTSQIAELDPTTLTWTNVPSTGHADSSNDEAGWTLLPDGSFVAVDAFTSGTQSHAERYFNNQWNDAGNLVKLNDSAGLCGSNPSFEVGPAVLLPNGKVFATGATNHTAVYTPSTNSWVAGPDFPVVSGTDPDGIADGPGALLPSGNVLLMSSPCLFAPPAHFFEYNGSSLVRVSDPPNAPFEPSFVGRLMVLPTGEVLFTDGSSDVEIYRPRGRANKAWKPVVTDTPTQIKQGQRFRLTGKRLNGMSQASVYGDDSSSATNYPLVRITNNATGRVTYARTYGFSSMAVANSNKAHTQVKISNKTPTGASTLEVVANGIASDPVAITIQPR